MKTVVFNNKVFFSLLTGYIAILLLYNAYSSLRNSDLYGIIPICIQLALLILIFTKNKHIKTIIITWSIVFLIIGPGLGVAGYLLDGFNSDLIGAGLTSAIVDLINIMIGVLVYSYAKKTISVSMSTEKQFNKK